MKHANKIYDLLATGEEENITMACNIIDKHISEYTVLGFAAMFAQLNLCSKVTHTAKNNLLDKMEAIHLNTFNEPLHYMVREMFHLALHGSYQSIFSLEFTHQAYQDHIKQLYKANRNLLEFKGDPDESEQSTKNK